VGSIPASRATFSAEPSWIQVKRETCLSVKLYSFKNLLLNRLKSESEGAMGEETPHAERHVNHWC